MLANLIDAGDVKLSWGVSYREVWHEGISDALRFKVGVLPLLLCL